MLAQKGVVSRFGVDFFVGRRAGQGDWDVLALEINLRVGGTTHPFLALQFLTGGRLDEESGTFLSVGGLAKFYRSTDNLKSESYRGLCPEDLIDVTTSNRLHYSHGTETGVLFHMIGALSQFGKLGLTAIGNSPEQADAISRAPWRSSIGRPRRWGRSPEDVGSESNEDLGGPMKVQDVMTAPARSCPPGANIVTAARAMWDYKCGVLPVLDEHGKPVGVITDRDICMALARKNRFPADIAVGEVMSPNPFVCRPEEEITEVLARMASRPVRRLPVVDGEGRLVGIVSISDIAVGARSGRRTVSGADVVHRMVAEALEKIFVHDVARSPEEGEKPG